MPVWEPAWCMSVRPRSSVSAVAALLVAASLASCGADQKPRMRALPVRPVASRIVGTHTMLFGLAVSGSYTNFHVVLRRSPHATRAYVTSVLPADEIILMDLTSVCLRVLLPANVPAAGVDARVYPEHRSHRDEFDQLVSRQLHTSAPTPKCIPVRAQLTN